MIMLIAFISTGYADIYKCTNSNGRVRYLDNFEELQKKCDSVPVLTIRSPTKAEIAEYKRQKKIKAEIDYRNKVKATAKFLNDVEIERQEAK